VKILSTAGEDSTRRRLAINEAINSMRQTTLRIWLQPGVKRIPPGWRNAKEVSSEWLDPDCVEVTVEGNGSDLKAYLRSRPKLFNSWDRVQEKNA
jgi:hypothetical protein